MKFDGRSNSNYGGRGLAKGELLCSNSIFLHEQNYKDKMHQVLTALDTHFSLRLKKE